MKNVILAVALLCLAFIPSAHAANVNIDGLPAAASVAGANLFECEQTGINNKCTGTQIAAYIYGLMSGDATASGTGVVTFATVNSNVGTFGSATQCITTTQNAKGLTTAISAATCTPAIGSVTGTGTGVITALGVNVGTAGSFVVNGGALGTPSSGVGTNLTGTAAGLTAGNVTTNANLTGDVTSVGNASTLATVNTNVGSFGSATNCTAFTTNGKGLITAASQTTCTPALASITGLGTGVATALAIAPGTTGSFTTQDGAITTGNCLKWGPGIQDAGAACGSGGSGTVTSVGAGCGTSTGGSPITTSGTVSASITSRTVATTTDAVVSTDCGNIVYANDASAIAGTIAQAGTTGFATGSFFEICNINAGAYTLTPTTSTIGGKTTLVIPAGTASNPSCTPFKSDGTNYNLMDTVYGSGVAGAIGNALSSAGGLTSTIASGTAAMGTGAISSATCATVVTVTATNVATTDVVTASFNGDPTAVTGYVPLTTGMLTIIGYPTSGNVNFKVCNNTSASVTPGAITLNWRVGR